MNWTPYTNMILWTLGFGIFMYLVARVLFGWYNLGCWLYNKT